MHKSFQLNRLYYKILNDEWILYVMANLILAIEIDKFPPHKVKDEILIPQLNRMVVAVYHRPFTNIDLCKAILLKFFVMPIRARALVMRTVYVIITCYSGTW